MMPDPTLKAVFSFGHRSPTSVTINRLPMAPRRD